MANGIEQEVLEVAGLDQPVEDTAPEPIYRMFEGSKIPVSKAHGKLWKSRRDAAQKHRSTVSGSWDECIRYFNNDQFSRDAVNKDLLTDRRKRSSKETENIVYANATTMLPAVYSKNPKIDIAVDQSDLDDPNQPDEEVQALNKFAIVLERLVNKLISAQYVNLKPKIRRQALFALLTNYGWLKLQWNDKEFSSDSVYAELEKLSTEYENAKDDDAIAEIEGKLIAIEQQFDVVAQAGPAVTVKKPSDILIDPACDDASDLSSAGWVMEDDYLPTNFLRAVYMKKLEQEGAEQYAYLFQPTHIAEGGQDNSDTSGMRFINYDGGEREDADKYDESYFTKVTYVWDKVTRRVFLYNEKDWSWPLWVWEDPLQLSRFFPYFGLAFAPATTGVYGKGEVNYYLDQQDAINQINNEAAKVRSWAFNKFLYNKNLIKATEIDLVLKADGDKAYGIDIPDGTKLQDFWAPLLPPAAAHPELFSKDDKYKVIDRMSAVTDAMRGTQFKTNTTNDAVNANKDAAMLRVGEKVDCLEDMLADLGRSIAELCVSKFTQDDVARILSHKDAQSWRQQTVREFNSTLTCSIAAGSTEKPTSANKQQQALQMGQVLGQFAKANPAISLVVVRLMERAFDNLIIDRDDFEQIKQSMEQQLGQGGATGDQAGLQQALSAMANLLPPQVKAMIQSAVQNGASPLQAIMQIAQQAQGAGAEQQ